MLEALCARCGEIFNPADNDDIMHVETSAGDKCGGIGEIIRYMPMG